MPSRCPVLKALVALAALAVFAVPPAARAQDRRVLVFHKHNGVSHASTDTAVAILKRELSAHGIAAESTRDSLAFTAANLARFGAVVFLNTNYRGGALLARAQEAAFEAFVRAGGGFVGVHNAAPLTGSAAIDSVWPWYVRMYGTRFVSHPAPQEGVVVLEDTTHVSTRGLPLRIPLKDEWYLLQDDPRAVAGITVLARVDASTLAAGGKDRPVTWCRAYDGGRAWMTTLGHDLGTFGDARFLAHLRGGVLYAGGWDGTTSLRRHPSRHGAAGPSSTLSRTEEPSGRLYRLPGEATWRTLVGRHLPADAPAPAPRLSP